MKLDLEDKKKELHFQIFWSEAEMVVCYNNSLCDKSQPN